MSSETDEQLVVVERPIDAIAYRRAHGNRRACYVYVGANCSVETRLAGPAGTRCSER